MQCTYVRRRFSAQILHNQTNNKYIYICVQPKYLREILQNLALMTLELICNGGSQSSYIPGRPVISYIYLYIIPASSLHHENRNCSYAAWWPSHTRVVCLITHDDPKENTLPIILSFLMVILHTRFVEIYKGHLILTIVRLLVYSRSKSSSSSSSFSWQ